MSLLGRQSATYEFFDDQGSAMWGSFVGNWTRRIAQGYNNNTFTTTSTPGASFSFSFSGSQAWIFGDNGTDGAIISHPTADYQLDDFPTTSQQPWLDSATGRIVYFQTPSMADGAHKIGITVTSANATNQFFLDYITVTPSSGVENSQSVPTSTATSSGLPTVTSSGLPIVSTHSTPVGTIVGGVVGGVAGIATLVIVLWWCLWRRGSRAQPRPGGTLVDEGHIEPFVVTATPFHLPPGFGRPDPQPEYPRQAVVGSDLPRPRSGGDTLIIHNRQDIQQPIREEDARAGFDRGGEPGAGLSRVHDNHHNPPSYTSH